jgi:hypothetical protein
MNASRYAALSVLACAGALSLAACSGGIISAGSSTPSATPSPSVSYTTGDSNTVNVGSTTGATASPTSSTTSGSSGSGTTVSVGASVGTFPIPPGATVVDNETTSGETGIAISGVSASQVSSFYSSALPQAGYTITENTEASGSTYTGTAIEFTGHGYKGSIGALSGTGFFSGISSISGTTGSLVGITLTPQS